MKKYVIETKQLTKDYGSVLALDHVDIHVKQGSIYGLIGDNGAGKTTLLKLLVGHAFPTDGEICLLGQYKIKELERCRRQIGAIVEQPGLYPTMTVENILEYYRIQKGVPSKGKVEEMLRLTGIWEKRKSRCGTLSLGQKQRLGLAVAIIGEPRLLILDEPINGLDPSGIIEVRYLLKRLNEEKNITILLSSHILSELQQLATDFGFLYRGKILEEITAEALLEKCTDYLYMMVSDAEKYAALLDRNFPDESFKLLPDGRIQITDPKQEAEVYSRLAGGHGIYITGMEKRHASLEDYYMELKKEGAERC